MVARPRILFCIFTAGVGGVEKSLISLINALPASRFDIHLALALGGDDLVAQLNKPVTVHTIECFNRNKDMVLAPAKSIVKRFFRGDWGTAIPAAWLYGISQLKGTLHPYIKWLVRNDYIDDGGEPFDLVVDFPGPPGEYIAYYAACHLPARRRAAWIHMDLSHNKYFRRRSAEKVYDSVDAIFCVSRAARDNFLKRCPQYAAKTQVFHNIINSDDIQRRADDHSAMERLEGAVNIVTVGRISPEKGQVESLDVIKELLDRGLKIRWHFIGGRYHSELLERAKKMGIGDAVRVYGPQANPYPYMKGADIYVQPSLDEGFCITLAEALTFGMPIVANDFSGAREQLSTVPNAQIVPLPFNTTALADAIAAAAKMPHIKGKTSASTADELQNFRNLAEGDWHPANS